jgi:hypothetical protein
VSAGRAVAVTAVAVTAVAVTAVAVAVAGDNGSRPRRR